MPIEGTNYDQEHFVKWLRSGAVEESLGQHISKGGDPLLEQLVVAVIGDWKYLFTNGVSTETPELLMAFLQREPHRYNSVKHLIPENWKKEN